MFKLTVIAATLFIATAINVIAVIISWYRAKTKIGFYFAIGITSHTLWALASGLDYAAVPIPLKVFFAKWEYSFSNMTYAFFLLFMLSYAGYVELANSKPLRAALWLGCGSNVLLAWTNDWHGWLWSGFSPGNFGNNTVVFEHGPAYLWVVGTSYLLYWSIILSAWLISRQKTAYARQGRIMFWGFLLPMLGNLIYQLEPPELKGMDWTGVFASFSAIPCVWALYGTKLLDLTPIAREKLIDSLSDGMIVLDTQGRIVDINQSASQMIGSISGKLLGRNINDVLQFDRSLADQPLEKELRTELQTGGKENRCFDVLVSPLIERQNVVIGQLVTFRDITERKHAQDELQKLARTDSLTGLLNRRYFFEIAEKEFAKSVRYARPLSVILFDVDLFKNINDTFGHLTGDKALVHIGKLLLEMGRQTDVAARYGGEEFVLLLTETDCEAAKIVAERLRKLMEEFPIQSDKGAIHFSASFGVSGMGENEPAETLDRLISQADQALYEAKRTGRNRVVCYC